MPKSVNIKSFLPQREIEICQRVRQVRLKKKWSQPHFAKELGISRARLASYEYAKAPIRYELGRLVCYRFNVNQRWLAEGREPVDHTLDISQHTEALFPVRTLFSEAYDRFLKPEIEERISAVKSFIGRSFEAGDFDDVLLDSYPLIGASPREAALFFIKRSTEVASARMPPTLQLDFAQHIHKAVGAFYQKHKVAIERWVSEQQMAGAAARAEKESAKEGLTVDDVSNMNAPDMTLANVITRLRNVTRGFGDKAQLARDLDVTRAAVSAWLGGVHPSGKTMLKLLSWVEKAEAKQKNSAGASTPAEPTAQTLKGKSNETKPVKPGRTRR